MYAKIIGLSQVHILLVSELIKKNKNKKNLSIVPMGIIPNTEEKTGPQGCVVPKMFLANKRYVVASCMPAIGRCNLR